MKNKISSFKNFLKKIIKKKRTWFILGVVIIAVLIIASKSNASAKNVITETAQVRDLKQTVLATGQVVSNTDLDLSFNSSGNVKNINVVVGDKVKKGDVLATLDQGQAKANLTSAQGSLAAAKARLSKVLEGADVTLAKIALDNAKTSYENVKKTQETLVRNAYNKLLNSKLEAVPSDGTSDYTAPTISGYYSLGKEGDIHIKTYYSTGGASFLASGLVEGSGDNNTITAQPIGDSGLYIKFPSDTTIDVKDWVIHIPNKAASDYLTNYNAYQTALKTQQSALDEAKALVTQRQTEYDLKKVTSSGSDVEIAQADVLTAQGQLEKAQALYNDTKIIAPADGTITSVDTKIGELASAQKEVIILQNVSDIHLETNINEANIADLKLGMPIDITFDAFGPDKTYTGAITKIDPSSSLISGVVNYKVTASINNTENLRPGMTANMTINVDSRDSVLSVPTRAILTDNSGNKTIRLITNTKKKKWKEVPIKTDLLGDSGNTEITKGLKTGDEIVVLIKN